MLAAAAAIACMHHAWLARLGQQVSPQHWQQQCTSCRNPSSSGVLAYAHAGLLPMSVFTCSKTLSCRSCKHHMRKHACCSQQIRFGLQSPQDIINCGVFHVYERALYKVGGGMVTTAGAAAAAAALLVGWLWLVKQWLGVVECAVSHSGS